jgi:nucleoid DNA-binding protein
MNEKTSFSDLIDKLSGKVEKSQGFTQEFMRELVSIIESGLKENGSVSISGFGKFEVRWMDERKGTNPQTGEEITIPAQNKVVFKPYKALREHVNRPYARMEPHLLDDSQEKLDHEKEKVQPLIPPTGTVDDPDDDFTDEEFEEPDAEPVSKKISEPGSESSESELSEGISDGDEVDYEAAPFPFFTEEEDEDIPDDEDQDELIIERESPVDYEPVTEIAGEPIGDKSAEDEELVINFQETAAPKFKTEDKSSFSWTYVAAAMIVLLIILALFYLMNRPPEMAEPVAEPPQVEAEPPPAIEEPLPNDIEETEFIAIIVVAGQNLWNLANNFLGDPYLWPWIYHLNSEAIDNPNQIYNGSDLIIPVPADSEHLSDSDRREVASGYVDVYQWYRDHSDEEARFYLWAAGVFDISIYEEIEGQVDTDDLNFARNR